MSCMEQTSCLEARGKELNFKWILCLGLVGFG